MKLTMKIQRIKLIIAAGLLLLGMGSCSKDNYDEPEATITGGVYDAKDGTLIPTQQPNGIRVRLYEKDYKQPTNFDCMPDGTFKNTRLFPGHYRVTVEGPFVSSSIKEQDVTIPASDVHITAEPLIRIKAKSQLSGNTVSVSYSISKSEQSKGGIRQIYVLCGNTIGLSATTASKRVNIDPASVQQGVEQTAAITDVDTSKPVFVRVAARSTESNYYNYSEIVRLK